MLGYLIAFIAGGFLLPMILGLFSKKTAAA